jgi:hypothetical protein
MKSFFEKLKAKIEELFTKAPAADAAAAETIRVVAPLVETLLAIEDPALEAIIAPIVTKVQAALATAAVTIQDAGPALTLQSALSSVTTNLTAIEQAAQIKSPESATKVTAITTTIAGEINAIAAAYTPPPVAA